MKKAKLKYYLLGVLTMSLSMGAQANNELFLRCFKDVPKKTL